MKIIKVSGSGPHKPTKASEVSLHYKLMLEDGVLLRLVLWPRMLAMPLYTHFHPG